MLLGILVFRVSCKNLQLALLFRNLLEDILNKDSNKFFIRPIWWYTYQTVQNWHTLDYSYTSAQLVLSFRQFLIHSFLIHSFFIHSSVNSLFFVFRQLPPAFAIFSGFGDSGGTSVFRN